MLDIGQYFDGLAPEDAREAAYYLSRYFKGSMYLEENGKDIFADVFDRDPEQRVRDITLKILGLIEVAVGKPASQFDEETADLVLDQITDFESSLDGNPSAARIADASRFFGALKDPYTSEES